MKKYRFIVYLILTSLVVFLTACQLQSSMDLKSASVTSERIFEPKYFDSQNAIRNVFIDTENDVQKSFIITNDGTQMKDAMWLVGERTGYIYRRYKEVLDEDGNTSTTIWKLDSRFEELEQIFDTDDWMIRYPELDVDDEKTIDIRALGGQFLALKVRNKNKTILYLYDLWNQRLEEFYSSDFDSITDVYASGIDGDFIYLSIQDSDGNRPLIKKSYQTGAEEQLKMLTDEEYIGYIDNEYCVVVNTGQDSSDFYRLDNLERPIFSLQGIWRHYNNGIIYTSEYIDEDVVIYSYTNTGERLSELNSYDIPEVHAEGEVGFVFISPDYYYFSSWGKDEKDELVMRCILRTRHDGSDVQILAKSKYY